MARMLAHQTVLLAFLQDANGVLTFTDKALPIYSSDHADVARKVDEFGKFFTAEGVVLVDIRSAHCWLPESDGEVRDNVTPEQDGGLARAH